MYNDRLTLSVTQLNKYVNTLMKSDENLNNVYIVGEISNFRGQYASGHLYFSLKDDGAVIRCVMYKFSAVNLKFSIDNGMKVIIRGNVALYEKDGTYQITCADIQPDGIGALTMAYEELRKKLAADGLFDENKKRPLPKYPGEIAVVTSETGAAVRDIISVISRRYPLATILMCPVLVQGESAAPDIVNTLKMVWKRGTSDLIIVGRGGGSIEDLWAFNEEITVRAVAASPIPIISAVGHETDTTLCDFAADLRAATPSAAAEAAVPDTVALLKQLSGIGFTLKTAMETTLNTAKLRLERAKNNPAMKSPLYQIQQSAQGLDMLMQRMNSAYATLISANNARLQTAVAALHTLSPLAVLCRGYALAYKENELIKSVLQVESGDEITLRLADGSLDCSVNQKGQQI